MNRLAKLGFVATMLAAACSAVWADINVGVVVSTTGPAASLGIPEKNTVALLPTTIGGQKVNYIILDDASDTTAAVANTRKLISESKADVIIGSSTTPNSLAMIDVVAENKTPMVTLGASARIISPMDAKKAWVFKTPQNDAMMAEAIAESMAKSGVKTAAYIGFNDAYGEGWQQEFKKAAEARGIKIVATEAFSRTDTSVTGQALKIMAAKPDAVLVGLRHARRAARENAQGARLQGQVLPDARRRECRFPARGWQGRRGHAAARGAGAGCAPVARQPSGEEVRSRLCRVV